MDKLKEQYNFLLKRMIKADIFFKTCTEMQLEKHYPVLVEIMDEMDEILRQIIKKGYEINPKEITGGFEL